MCVCGGGQGGMCVFVCPRACVHVCAHVSLCVHIPMCTYMEATEGHWWPALLFSTLSLDPHGSAWVTVYRHTCDHAWLFMWVLGPEGAWKQVALPPEPGPQPSFASLSAGLLGNVHNCDRASAFEGHLR